MYPQALSPGRQTARIRQVFLLHAALLGGVLALAVPVSGPVGSRPQFNHDASATNATPGPAYSTADDVGSDDRADAGAEDTAATGLSPRYSVPFENAATLAGYSLKLHAALFG